MDTQVQNTSLEEVSKQPPLLDVAKIKHILTDGVYVKAYLVPKGMRVTSKKFDHAHLIILAQGSMIREMPDGTRVKYTAPAHYNLPADTRESGVTLEDCTWYCIHPTDETDPEVLWEKY